MKSLYLRIYVTVVAVLLAFALVAGWVVKRNIEQERETFQNAVSERTAAWAALIEHRAAQRLSVDRRLANNNRIL